MRVAIIFKNFGPYHLARIGALGAHCTVLPVEIHETSAEYKWGNEAGKFIERTTLVFSDESPLPTNGVIRERLNEQMGRLQPDVIAVPGWFESVSLAAILWAREHGVPIVMMSETNRHDEQRRFYKEWAKSQIITMCSAALVGGSSHASYMRELGMSRTCIADGYDVVDNDYFELGARTVRNEASTRRAESDLPESYFLASSRLIPRKNLLRLIEAWDNYRSRVGNGNLWSLVIVGYGAEEHSLRAAIEQRGVASWVKLLGFQPYDKLPVLYGLAGAFIHPALSEPWGLVVNEAMASGLPCLVSRTCGCAPDLVIDGETGFQFDPENIHQLADLMLRISSHHGPRLQLGEQAQKRIRQWSPARFGNSLAALAEAAMMAPAKSSPTLSILCLRTLLSRA
jgi:glycosyltransferase involved in cell wall biosynthesis